MIAPLTLLLLALKLADVSQAWNKGSSHDFPDDYDEPPDVPIVPIFRFQKHTNKIVHFEAVHSNQGISLIWNVANADMKANLTVRVLVHEVAKLSLEAKVLSTKKFQINAVSCSGEAYGEVPMVTCRHDILVEECADLFFELEGTGLNASAKAITVSPGTVMLERTSNETLLRWNISCDDHSTAPLHLTIRDQETNEARRVTLEGLCFDRECVSNIRETMKDFHFLPCAIYDMTIDGYPESKLPFLHWSTADQAQTANVIAKYSNQTLMLTVTFEAEVKICNENLRAVNVTSPEGFFQPQSIRCVSKDGDSTKRCSGTVRTTIEKLICRSEITVNILPVYGREEETSYAIDGGTAEFTAMIEKETEWDGGKSVVGLRVDIDKQDITVEWEDPFCPIEGLNSFNMKLTTGPLNSGNHLKLRIPTKCSRWQTRNRVLIVKGEKLMCLTGDNSEETSLRSDFKLLSCANYSLSVTPFALGEVSKSINFVSPFQSQDIANVTSKTTQSGFELQWDMPENCPVSTELDVKINNDSHKIRPFEKYGIGDSSTECVAKKCVSSWKITENLIPCKEYLIRIGSAHSRLTIPPSIKDYLFEEKLLVSLSKERSLRVDFVINGTQKRCLTYLHALEVIFRQPYAKHEYKWIASCLESRDIDGNVTCSQIVPFGFINACRNHSISYRPRFSLTGETANVWNNEDVGPFANSSKLLVIPVMRVQSEHRDHISVKWKSPSCLFGSIVKWKLSIETGENSSFYSVEIPFNCSSVDHALSNEDEGYEYSIKIRNNETECHNGAPLLVNKLELSSCTIYRIKLWPIVNVSNERSLLVGEFKLNETLATDIDYNDVQDVSVVDVESRSFNIELTVPKRCAGFNVRQLRVNGKVKNTSLAEIEMAGCTDDDNCTLKWKSPLEAVPYTSYDVSIGFHSVQFTTSLKNDEGAPSNITETTINEDTLRIKWGVAPNLKGLLAGWRICVTDAKRQSDIIDENVPAGQNSFDIHIPYANISTPEKANNESQKCPVFLYRLGAVWSGEVGNEASRTIWTENKELNYTSCELNTSIGDYSIANDYKAGKSIFSLQVLIILCVSGGVLLLSVVAVAVHYARKTGTWNVKN